MNQKEQHQNRQQWQQLVALWQESGLSAAKFCRDMQLNYDNFLYYKRQMQGDAGDWKEIIDVEQQTGISLQLGAVTIAVERQFDAQTLRLVVEALSHARTR